MPPVCALRILFDIVNGIAVVSDQIAVSVVIQPLYRVFVIRIDFPAQIIIVFAVVVPNSRRRLNILLFFILRRLFARILEIQGESIAVVCVVHLTEIQRRNVRLHRLEQLSEFIYVRYIAYHLAVRCGIALKTYRYASQSVNFIGKELIGELFVIRVFIRYVHDFHIIFPCHAVFALERFSVFQLVLNPDFCIKTGIRRKPFIYQRSLFTQPFMGIRKIAYKLAVLDKRLRVFVKVYLIIQSRLRNIGYVRYSRLKPEKVRERKRAKRQTEQCRKYKVALVRSPHAQSLFKRHLNRNICHNAYY